eukprot:GEMP01018449.1.p1 GENE.GEMP01018449.1~~GEMP01018449.1.p1  ORF type:complete len:316 (+),score=106.60 GEMP01018449.1:45-992(+)
MKTKVKTLQGVLFELEIAQDDTVKRVKEKLAELKPETFVAEGMKLIFAGKILVDDKILLSEYGVKETDFLVAMSTKPPQNAVDPNLQRLIDMGFDKDQATNALQAAGNNPDIAAELLMGGGDGDNDAVMPPAATTPSPAQQTAAATPAAAANAPSAVPIGESPGTTPFPAMGAVAGSGGGGGGGGGGGLAQNPAMMQELLQRVAETNPEMFQRIQQNPQEFLQFLAGAQNMSEEEQMQLMAALGGGDVFGDGDEEDAPMVVPEIFQGNLPELNEQEQQSVARLQELGFSREQAVEAYMVCDRDENAAANFLFNSM